MLMKPQFAYQLGLNKTLSAFEIVLVEDESEHLPFFLKFNLPQQADSSVPCHLSDNVSLCESFLAKLRLGQGIMLARMEAPGA